MNRRITRTAALALMGTALLAPGVASADPSFSATVTGAPYFDPELGMYRQQVDLFGQDCVNPEGDSHMGEWISTEGDPWVVGGEHYFDVVTENGGFHLEGHAVLDPAIDQYHARLYCATSTPGSLDDEAMLWVSPVGTMTLTGEDTSPVITLGNRQANRPTASAASLTDLRFDADALPLIDKIGIPGDTAAKLKAQVDERYADVSRIQRMYEVFLGRRADPQGLEFWERQAKHKAPLAIAKAMADSNEFRRVFGATSDADFLERLYETTLGRGSDPSGRRHWGAALSSKKLDRAQVGLAFADSAEFTRRTQHANYVSTAFQVLTPGRANPSPKVVDAYAERLAAGELKVTVVEDIALTIRDADWWIARG